ncbi:MAG: hypothetical protein ACI9WU_001768 [Myxococcota bacterium]|jgi:hypothetical protein
MSNAINEKLSNVWINKLLSTPQGRSWVLTQAGVAEDSDEGIFFTRLLANVEDPKLQSWIRIHEGDEKRHAEMFHQAAQRQGVPVREVPPELQLIDRLNQETGGFFDREIHDDRGVMEAALLLQVIEERAVTQFKMFEPVMRKYDPLSADLLAQISQDEDRHLKYCRAIAKRHAPNEHAMKATLRRFRHAEARAFTGNALENMKQTLKLGIVKLNPLEKVMWRGVMKLSASGRMLDTTPFWDDADHAPTGGSPFSAAAVAAIVASSPHA